MNILYLGNCMFPSKSAHTNQIINMASSLKATLISFTQQKINERTIISTYDVDNFPIKLTIPIHKNYYLDDFFLVLKLMLSGNHSRLHNVVTYSQRSLQQ